jgi:hypothetical protein
MVVFMYGCKFGVYHIVLFAYEKNYSPFFSSALFHDMARRGDQGEVGSMAYWPSVAIQLISNDSEN